MTSESQSFTWVRPFFPRELNLSLLSVIRPCKWRIPQWLKLGLTHTIYALVLWDHCGSKRVIKDISFYFFDKPRSHWLFTHHLTMQHSVNEVPNDGGDMLTVKFKYLWKHICFVMSALTVVFLSHFLYWDTTLDGCRHVYLCCEVHQETVSCCFVSYCHGTNAVNRRLLPWQASSIDVNSFTILHSMSAEHC